nr:MAG TPA: hypothetical protein [Caudoviricetes sp.]
MSKLFEELEEIFDGTTSGPFLNPEKEGRLAKLAIKCELENGLPNGPYYVNGTEVTMDNIDSFSPEQLAKSSFDHTDRIMSDPNAVLIF